MGSGVAVGGTGDGVTVGAGVLEGSAIDARSQAVTRHVRVRIATRDDEGVAAAGRHPRMLRQERPSGLAAPCYPPRREARCSTD